MFIDTFYILQKIKKAFQLERFNIITIITTISFQAFAAMVLIVLNQY